jgi:hypothetical protein
VLVLTVTALAGDQKPHGFLKHLQYGLDFHRAGLAATVAWRKR